MLKKEYVRDGLIARPVSISTSKVDNTRATSSTNL